MFKKVSAIAMVGLLAGCGGPLENTWKTACNKASVHSVKMDGENFEYSVEKYLDSECTVIDTTTKQAAAYAVVNSGKVGVRNSMVLSPKDTVEYTYHNEQTLTSANDLLAKQKEASKRVARELDREIAAEENQARGLDLARKREIVRAVNTIAAFELNKSNALSRLQVEGMGYEGTFLGFVRRTDVQYEVDGDYLLIGGGIPENIFKKVD